MFTSVVVPLPHKPNSEMSVNELVAALDGLQSNAAERQMYNVWLQEFQRSPEAWQVVYEVLSTPTQPRALKIFCAQTLRNKVAFDLHQVPKESRMQLKDQVLSLLEQNADLLNVVGLQLCLALAAFAMQTSEWEDPIQELMAKFNSPEMVPLLFEFLKVLPVEFQSERAGFVDASLRLQRSLKLVQENAVLVLNFMLSQADIMSQTGDRQTLFFETLNPWLGEVDLTDIIASPLINWMFASLRSEEARPAAVDNLILVLRETSEVHEESVQQAITILLPQIVACANEFKQMYSDDSELHRDMTRLLSEAGMNWHTLIAKQPDHFMPVLTAVVDCVVGIENQDLEIVEYTFDFFDKLKGMLGEPLPGSSAPIAKSIDREPFKQTFMTLFITFVKLLQFPASFNNNLEEEEIFRDFRYEIGDMLKVCSSIAGHSSSLQTCYELLQSALTANTWQPLEAVLFSIRSIARTVPTSERTWLPKIYELISTISVSSTDLVQHAVLMLLGRYSQWSSNNSAYLEFELVYITNSATSANQETRRAAAHAFLYLCTDSAKQLLPFWQQLFEFYTKLSGSVDVESMCKYADGLGAVLNQLFETNQLDTLKLSLDMLFQPVVARACDQVNTSTNEKAVACDIQGIGSMIAMISQNEALDSVLQSNAPVFISLLVDLGQKSDILLTSIARFFIHAIFNAAKAIEPAKTGLYTAIYTLAKTKPSSSAVLYELGSAVIQNFSSDEETWQFGQSMCEILFNPTVVEGMKEQGEIVEYETDITMLVHHGVHFLCDLAVYFPKPYFQHLFEPTTLLTIEAINLCWDHDVLTAIGHLYDDVESFLPAIGELDSKNVDVHDEIVAVVEKNGYALIRSLFYWFLLKLDTLGETTVERIVDFAFRVSPVSAIAWLQQVLTELPAGTASDDEKMVFAGQVFKLMSSNRFRGIGHEMGVFVKAYTARNYLAR